MHPSRNFARPPWRDGRTSVPVLLLLAALVACSSKDGDDDAAAHGGSGAPPVNVADKISGGSGGAEAVTRGGASATGGTHSTSGGQSSPASGGRSTGATSNGSGGNSSSAGAASNGASAGVPSEPPGAGPDGRSPYAQECHGDSLECGDMALRCLGIRDASAVFGFTCSNPCNDVSDCSTLDSGAEASAGCVELTSERHCMLVCKDDSGEKTCPDGMSCYQYPGFPIGFCLWR